MSLIDIGGLTDCITVIHTESWVTKDIKSILNEEWKVRRQEFFLSGSGGPTGGYWNRACGRVEGHEALQTGRGLMESVPAAESKTFSI